MTHEELERIMNFIILRQEVAADQIATLAENQVKHDSRLAEHNERIARFERSYTAISDLLRKHDGQLDEMTKGLNELIATVNRYITARGSNGAGGGDAQS